MSETKLDIILKSVVSDDSNSAIFSWLKNVLEQESMKQLHDNNNKSLPQIDLYYLYSICYDMLIIYGVCSNYNECLTFCQKLLNQLIDNKIFELTLEKYPINTKIMGLYNEDGLYYPAIIIKIIIHNYQYLILFDHYYNQQEIFIHQIQSLIINNDNNNNNDIKDDINNNNNNNNISLKSEISKQEQQLNDLNLNNILGNENDDYKCGLTKIKKYYNTPMIINDIPDTDNTINNNNNDANNINEQDFAKYEEESQKDDDDDDDDNNNNNKDINPKNDECCICKRTLALTFHHLIPKSTHSKILKPQFNNNNNYSQDYLHKHGIWCCRPCHSAIHGIYDHWTLATQYYDLKLLLNSIPLQKWINYIQKRKITAHGKDSRNRNQQNRIAKMTLSNDETMKIKFIK